MDWLIHSDAGLLARIVGGIVIFAVLGAVDLKQHGAAATRWKEYVVLLAAVGAALIYGVVNDQITATISWEYFYYGKNLEHVLGPELPPAMGPLHWEAAKVGLKATWSAGLIFGVVLLLANNPFQGLPRLRYRELLRVLLIIPVTAALLGAIFGLLGYMGFLTHASNDFVEMTREDMFRPYRFMCTWGVHLGGYLGGFLGTALAAIWIMRKRMRLNSARLHTT